MFLQKSVTSARGEGGVMNELNWTPRTCFACQAELRNTDKFCRHCGIKQLSTEGAAEWAAQCPTTGLANDTGPRAQAMTRDFGAAESSPLTYETKMLARPVSGPLLKAVTHSVSLEGAISSYDKITKNIILALLSIPVWLMIVLLSPLDAWATTRTIARQI